MPTLQEQLKKIADEMNQSTTGYVKNADGSVTTSITIPADYVTTLEAWAEGAGEDFPTYVKRMAEEGIMAVVMS